MSFHKSAWLHAQIKNTTVDGYMKLSINIITQSILYKKNTQNNQRKIYIKHLKRWKIYEQEPKKVRREFKTMFCKQAILFTHFRGLN